MGDNADESEKKENVLKVEEAKSGRSTCKSTGEKIEKGEIDASLYRPSAPGRPTQTGTACRRVEGWHGHICWWACLHRVAGGSS